jgi:thiol-disulfide isomerase/thioredoxin
VARARYLIAALLLVIAAAVAVAVASQRDPADVSGAGDVDEILSRPPGPPAPEVEAVGWLNSPGLRPADLDGKVVVYDFWTYSCVNCVRTMPFLRAWYDRYADEGLEIIGVHSPEFEFEKDHDNVAAAVQDLGVTWPVALDDEMAIWSAFQNRFWPAKYVFDREGRLRYFHAGEGAYDETEDVIRALLGVDEDAPRAEDGQEAEQPPSLPACREPRIDDERCQTPEIYLGSLRGDPSFASPEGLTDGGADFTLPDDQPLHSVALDGSWFVDAEAVTAGGGTTAIVLRYVGSEANLVLAPPVNGPVEVEVLVDGEPVAPDERGDDLKVRDGSTLVTVDRSDLFALVRHAEAAAHTLELRPTAAGVQAFAFTFDS